MTCCIAMSHTTAKARQAPIVTSADKETDSTTARLPNSSRSRSRSRSRSHNKAANAFVKSS